MTSISVITFFISSRKMFVSPSFSLELQAFSSWYVILFGALFRFSGYMKRLLLMERE